MSNEAILLIIVIAFLGHVSGMIHAGFIYEKSFQRKITDEQAKSKEIQQTPGRV